MDMFGQSPALLIQRCMLNYFFGDFINLCVLTICIVGPFSFLPTIFTMLHLKFSSDITDKKGNYVTVAVLVDVDYSTMGEFEEQAAVTDSRAV